MCAAADHGVQASLAGDQAASSRAQAMITYSSFLPVDAAAFCTNRRCVLNYFSLSSQITAHLAFWLFRSTGPSDWHCTPTNCMILSRKCTRTTSTQKWYSTSKLAKADPCSTKSFPATSVFMLLQLPRPSSLRMLATRTITLTRTLETAFPTMYVLPLVLLSNLA